MSRNIPLIVVMEGGMVQNIYSPDPEVRFDLVMIDYDLQDGSADDLAELVDALEQANQLERRYDYAPRSPAACRRSERNRKEGRGVALAPGRSREETCGVAPSAAQGIPPSPVGLTPRSEPPCPLHPHSRRRAEG